MFPLHSEENGNKGDHNKNQCSIPKNKSGSCTPKTNTEKFIQDLSNVTNWQRYE